MNDNPTSRPIFPATINPCPAWCAQPSGHGYAGLDVDNVEVTEIRFHSCELGEAPLTVDLCSEERCRVTGNGVSISASQPHIWLHGDHEMTGSQARVLAATLVTAADLWDEVTS